jgi:DNA polymerase zeta
MNPRPIKIKFEKVYHPCVLLAKKRYVGYKFETPDQSVPEFDAKGIETVRRDGTPAEQKIEEKALKILFETADLSQVKAYFQSQCAKIMRGSVSIQDFCFAREVRLGSYSAKGPPPPGALISTKKMQEDARAEPQYGERVSYVVISGSPGARLIDRCVAPEELLHSPDASLDAEYYMDKNIIPPLERIFSLVGANVRQWYDDMPKLRHVRKVDEADVSNNNSVAPLFGAAGNRKTLEWFMRSLSCLACGVKMKSATHTRHDPSDSQLCKRCEANAAASMVLLQGKVNNETRKYADVVKVCQSCTGMAPMEEVPCDSKDCPVFYTRVKQETRMRAERSVVEKALRRLEAKDLEW